MQFPWVTRKLKKLLYGEEMLVVRHDRFAPKRVQELKGAIEWLAKAPPPEADKVIEQPRPAKKKMNLSELVNQIPLFK